MDIKKREHDGVVVLDLEGKLTGTISGEGGPLSEYVLRSIRADSSGGPSPSLRVLLNFAGCTGADSLGIGELISLHVSLANRGGALKILHLPERIGELLRATQLISMFEVFDDEDAALAAFG